MLSEEHNERTTQRRETGTTGEPEEIDKKPKFEYKFMKKC